MPKFYAQKVKGCSEPVWSTPQPFVRKRGTGTEAMLRTSDLWTSWTTPEKILKRGEHIDILVDKTENLEQEVRVRLGIRR